MYRLEGIVSVKEVTVGETADICGLEVPDVPFGPGDPGSPTGPGVPGIPFGPGNPGGPFGP